MGVRVREPHEFGTCRGDKVPHDPKYRVTPYCYNEKIRRKFFLIEYAFSYEGCKQEEVKTAQLTNDKFEMKALNIILGTYFHSCH
jgi:hypothetical protein